MEEMAGFEEAAKKSWQSFSTMKRFVSEAGRLENASWRLWYMQRRRQERHPSVLSHPQQDPHHQHHQHQRQPGATMETEVVDGDAASARPLCVYCELHAASLSCHGCCHDAYCVSCFKLVHKKGHLATHTALKIQASAMSSPHMTTSGRRGEDVTVTGSSECSTGSSVGTGEEGMADSDSDAWSRYGEAGAVETTTTAAAAVRPGIDSWEIHMDTLLQRLMVNSIHGEDDISVHNIDRRPSLDTMDPMEAYSSHAQSSHVAFDGASSCVESPSAPSVSLESKPVLPASSLDRERSEDSRVDVAATVAPASATSTPLFPAPAVLPRTSSRKKNAVCANCNGNHITIDCPLLATSLPSSVAMQGSSSGGVGTVLRKCFTTLHNDHLSNSTHAFLGDEVSVRGGGHFSKGHFAQGAAASMGGGVVASDRGRPATAWTSFGMNSIEEDQITEAEDVLPVLHGLQLFPAPSSDTAFPSDVPRRWDFNSWMMSCLATDLPHDVYEMLRTVDKITQGGPPLPHAFAAKGEHPQNGQGDTLSNPDSDGDVGPSLSGWVHLKEPGRRWCKRFITLYRNNLWEYLDDRDTSRPIGYTNLSDGAMHVHQNTDLEFAVRYFRYSSPESPQNEFWIQCATSSEATQWRDALSDATKLQLEDLFDLEPSHSPSGSPSNPEEYELGKGRFANVRRACRKRLRHDYGSNSMSPESTSVKGEAHVQDHQSSQHCALKIIDKHTFWDLVAHDTEREDTVIREILTQTVLTVRAGISYCPVIRLLSLFETRRYLVMELELMCEGDLHEEIVSKSAVDEARASSLMASLVKAIDFCLQNGVAHRDIKLSNLALDYAVSDKGIRHSIIKIADFGMAAFIQKDGQLKGRCGTPGFVAPEILTAGKGESYKCGVDMFSVGVVMYTMLCGYEPFFGVNDEELIQMNKLVDYEFEEPEWSNISDEAKDLITRMMEKDTDRRVTPRSALQHAFLQEASATLDNVLGRITYPSPLRLL